ncbi:ABC transporter ATP-binding protein [Helicobacter pylori]|uniref:ABC transporter ATP-binding protein n=1 Tax=Helicobacter pylori TaxID=210 RepID=UPI000D36AB7E|nr:ABC transporter ATP-binding protein [Helicobacter pylori]PUD28580.1 ABC transporter ATP-binding protein [Helicobacter pylori]WQX29252.1 ABC transporter ATP-binding protein [Helicobacter pylori]WRB33277.1 ABC transporter ATP-binding protein [Helicobacter pylori]WRE85709.1 ABC transporter ATP-binding protein [Helicobacter pylori]
MIKAINISHAFEKPLYNGVNLHIKPKESLAILGVSGSGKSTLLSHLATMLKPNSGTISLLEHQDIYALNSKKLLELRRLKVGIIFQSHYLFKGFSALENLQVASILAKQEINHSLLEQLGIAHTLKQGVGELSGGQQQRLSIARVLSKKPKIIIADEPTGNLDTISANQVISMLQNYIIEEKGALVLATHDEHLAFTCSQVYRLEKEVLIKEK